MKILTHLVTTAARPVGLVFGLAKGAVEGGVGLVRGVREASRETVATADAGQPAEDEHGTVLAVDRATLPEEPPVAVVEQALAAEQADEDPLDRIAAYDEYDAVEEEVLDQR